MAESNDSEFHEKELNRHCRVCVGVVENTHYAYTCHEETNKTLLQNFGIDVDKDQPNIHPKVFCLCCRTKATQHSECTESTLTVFQWTPHTEPSCEVCCFFKEQKKGGRPKKERKNRGRPRSPPVVNSILLDTTHTQSWKASSPLSLSSFLPSTTVPLDDLQCRLCSCIIDQPVQTPCRKLVCSTCIVSLLRSCDLASFPCPFCKESHKITATSFPAATEVTMKVLGDLLLTCDKPQCSEWRQCSEVVALKNLRKHVASGCSHDTFSPSKLTVGHVHVHVYVINMCTLCMNMQVSLPGLHITLGVFYRLWSLLEEACHQLDLELSKHTAPLSTDRGSFSQYTKVVSDLAKLEEEKNELRPYALNLSSLIAQLGSQLQDPENHLLLTSLGQEAATVTKKLREVVRFKHHCHI